MAIAPFSVLYHASACEVNLFHERNKKMTQLFLKMTLAFCRILFYYDRRNLGGCYGQRHHSIPPKEELVVLGIGNYDEVYERDSSIIWTIPRRFIEFYKTEMQSGEYRIIDLEKQESRQNDAVTR